MTQAVISCLTDAVANWRRRMSKGMSILAAVSLALSLSQGCSDDSNPVQDDDPPQPIAHWTFDNPQNPGLDVSGNGHNGTVTGATVAPGMSGNGLVFDGGLDAMECGSSVLNTPPYTICAWVKPDTVLQGQARWVVSNGGESAQTFGYSLALQNNSTWQFTAKNSVGTGGNAHHGASGTDWVFLCGIWDGKTNAGSIKLYVDGQLASSGDPGTHTQGSESSLRIGAPSNPDHANDYHWLGIVDEIRIYNIALSSAQVDALYQQVR